MNGQNQNPGQVPDARLDQIMERLRRAEDQNAQLRGQIEYMAKQTGPQQQQQQRQTKFAPEVQAAIQEEVNAIIGPLREQIQQQQGFIYDQIDQVNFMQSYNKPQYEPYIDKVEQVRRDAQAKGQWISREQALQYVYFNETGKKPAPENIRQPEAPKAPVYDAFLGQFVNERGEVVPDPRLVDADALMSQAQTPGGQQPQPQQQMPQQQQMQQQPTQQPYQPQQQQWQPQQQMQQPQQQWQQPANNQWVPQQGNQTPQLPMAQPPEAHRMQQPGNQHLAIDLASSDQALAQWETRYGDVPL